MKALPQLEEFVYQTTFTLLNNLTQTSKPIWGNMDAQQMVEHLLISVEVGTGKRVVDITTPIERLAQVKSIGLMSLRPFQREVKNAILPATPLPHRFESLAQAIEQLKEELTLFANQLQQADFKRTHNVFGELNKEEWMWFHYKHFTHHLTQFGLIAEQERL